MAPRERGRSQRSGSEVMKAAGQLESSRSSGQQPEQLRGPEPALCKNGRDGGAP